MFINKLRVSTRLAIAGIAVIGGLALLTVIGVSSAKRDAMAAHQVRLNNLVDVAIGTVEAYAKLEASGQLSREDAQRQALETLRSPRFSKNDYYFLYDFDGRALMVAGKPDIEGKIMLGNVDSHGFKLWDRFVEIAKSSGSGYVEYWFPRAGQTIPKPKLSYVAAIPKWNWIVGTGVYIDDVDDAVRQAVIEYVSLSALILVVVTLVAAVISRGIVSQLGGEPYDVAEHMRRIANGDLGGEIKIKEGDQVSLMASLKLMQMKLINLTGSIHETANALAEQTESFDTQAKTFLATKSDESFAELQRLTGRLGRTSDILRKAINRFKL